MQHNKKCKPKSSRLTSLKYLLFIILLRSGRVARTRRYGSRALILGRDLRKPYAKSIIEENKLYSKATSWVYTIPLACILALLALLFIAANPNYALGLSSLNLAYADEPMVVDDSTSVTTYSASSSAPTASLTIGNGSGTEFSNTGTSNSAIEIGVDISVSASLINSYTLQISSTSNTLDGPSTINPITTSTTGVSELADNTWGYKWGDSTGGSSTGSTNNYKGITTVPSTIVSSSTSTSSDTSIDNTNNAGTVSFTKPLTFAVKFSKDAIAGHYSTTVNLALIANPKELVTYTLSYNGNGGSGVPSTQTVSNYNSSHTFAIDNTTPNRDGYEFIGYATTSTGSVAYQPSNTITLQASAPSQTLYAVWKETGPKFTLTFNSGSGTSYNFISEAFVTRFADEFPQQSSPTGTTSNSYTFTIPTTSGLASYWITVGGGACAHQIRGWNTTAGIISSTAAIQYESGSTITVNTSNPHVTLYPIWKTLSACA